MQEVQEETVVVRPIVMQADTMAIMIGGISLEPMLLRASLRRPPQVPVRTGLSPYLLSLRQRLSLRLLLLLAREFPLADPKDEPRRIWGRISGDPDENDGLST